MKYILISTLIISLLSLLFSPVNLLAYIGMFLCFTLSALGTARGILSISKYVSGASILAPHVGTKSILGTVVCEANFLTGIITCVMINNTLNLNIDKELSDKAHYIYFSSGLFVGICNYYSSEATGLICAVISMMDAKDPSLFYKIVILEIIPASIGLIGFIMGIVLNSKAPFFDLEN
ncbi:VATO2 [Hepatospora eriocheir]|uniref:VATO2 n=1 Tax=Hepatospora eriocheir TaxID=1081669 RepID=A0A1X0QED0_9MICR|nr:VATO2 [Hepatospora eriocheir]ORD99722.1 VATO2 [Hepatospora eriocheir]